MLKERLREQRAPYLWQQVGPRASYLPTCAPLVRHVPEQGRVTAATVVDHIIPHKLKEALRSGDSQEIAKAQKLFWSRKNWQGLCKQHHDSTKQRMEKRGTVIGCDESGMPPILTHIGLNDI